MENSVVLSNIVKHWGGGAGETVCISPCFHTPSRELKILTHSGELLTKFEVLRDVFKINTVSRV